MKFSALTSSQDSPLSAIQPGSFSIIYCTMCISLLHTRTATQVFSKCTFRCIHSLELILRADTATSHPEAAMLFTAIALSNRARTLRNLKISRLVLGPMQLVEDAVLSDALWPILALPICSLVLNLRWSWDLDNDLIHAMAQAWPDLHTLQLDNRGSWPSPSRITTYALEALVEHCLVLSDLHIVFNGETAAESCPRLDDAKQPTGGFPAGGKQNSHIWIIYVGSSSMGPPGPLALLLSRIFPRLTSLKEDLLYCHPRSPSPLLREVMDLLTLFRHAREQERLALATSFSESAQP
ncbi:hypothetical protein BXZ70DRAFT_488145 [Cristinia sonorae]|uniref:Uncharacterized protein n=1 Tax=Cristinia sonorae TaxID=1940300 RepID=A0A8K0XLJ0_9AGAR|nr:hypothetical protein BXZ70DRAFT_488145 [Cristinia sonorae]